MAAHVVVCGALAYWLGPGSAGSWRLWALSLRDRCHALVMEY